MRDLGIVAGSYNEARGINDAGQVVGFYYGNTGVFSVHAFMTGPNAMGMKELDTWAVMLTLLASTMQGRSWVPRVVLFFWTGQAMLSSPDPAERA